MNDPTVLISYLALMSIGVIAMILSKTLPDKVMFLIDEKKFVVSDKKLYIETKRKQFKTLGFYYVLAGILNLTLIKNQILSMAIIFVVPLLIMGVMDKKLRSLYRLR